MGQHRAVNTDVVSNLLVKVSTPTGLIYTQERKYDPVNDLYAVYWVALDFRTGKVVWEKLMGTFGRHVRQLLGEDKHRTEWRDLLRPIRRDYDDNGHRLVPGASGRAMRTFQGLLAGKEERL